MNNRIKLVKSIIGEKGYETLNKAISKLNTRSVVDISELHDSIKIVPKVIMSFLMLYTKKMKAGDSKTLDLPWADNCHLLINKQDQDVYSGHIDQDGKIQHEFSLVSVPQLAAHILSYFEMYDEDLGEEKPENSSLESESSLIETSLAESNDKYELGNKIVTLLTLLATNMIDEEESKTEESFKEKSEIEKAEKIVSASKKDLAKSLKQAFNKKLNKANTTGAIASSTKMPSPPKPGAKVGGSQGITKEGIHSPKTASTDMPGHEAKTHVKNPDLKVSAQGKSMFKLPKIQKLAASEEEPKHIPQITMTKNEYSSQCVDCGSKLSQCQCFTALSKPTVVPKKDKVELNFKSDWDSASVIALINSVKAKRG